MFTLTHFGVKYTLLMAEQKLIQVDLVALVEDQATMNPIVLLHDRTSNKLLPIWIGEVEARAITIALNKEKMSRPLTHKLLINVVGSMNGKLSRVVIEKLKNKTYYASLRVRVGDKEILVDARPSDAIALALEAPVSIFVAAEVMDAGGQENPFANIPLQQEKREMKKEDVEKLKELLARAREREEETLG